MAWRRKWVIVLPTIVVAVAVVLWTRQLVDMYRSESTILVVPPQVPEDYVRPTVRTRIEDRLQAIQQQIMSRTRLERIILDLDLYARERETGIMEDIVENMRQSVQIQPIRGDAFRVAFVNEDPRLAMRVTERLTSLFIDESLRDREVLAEGTNQFLESQLEEARRVLVENERRLEEYRRRFDGQLPDQLNANVQGLHNTQMQVQALVETLNRDRERRLVLERGLADLHAMEGTTDFVPTSGGTSTVAQQLEAAEKALADLQLRLTSEHPDVVRARRTVAELQQRADDEAAARPVSADATALAPDEAARRARIAETERQLAALDKQITFNTEQEAKLREVIAGYQRRIESTPTRQSELADLMRDYSTYQANYQSLLAKQQQSQLAANLERRQIGEQFRVLDPARLPVRPFSPDRPRYYSMGVLAGLALGLGLALVVEYFDRTMRSDDDVRAALSLPVLATVPQIVDVLALRQRLRLVFAFSLSSMVLVGTAAAVAWAFLR
jgi:polysaccharide chain length determinant protein (PEP-CTERM system associated)